MKYIYFNLWSSRNNKDEGERRKTEIFNRFKAETGLIIGKCKHGAGTTNDGNTARRFFQGYKKSAEITGLNEHILKNFL